MSENQDSRPVIALPPRPARVRDARALVKSQRGSAVTPQVSASSSAQLIQPDEAKVQINARVVQSVAQRAKAAFLATSYLEGVESFSEFVERALLAEAERLEAAHNAGAQYEPPKRLRLTPGPRANA